MIKKCEVCKKKYIAYNKKLKEKTDNVSGRVVKAKRPHNSKTCCRLCSREYNGSYHKRIKEKNEKTK